MTKNNMRNQKSELSSKLTASNFFIDNNPNGVINATPFMDYYDPMKANNSKLFKKHEMLWESVREGRPINGLINVVYDKRNNAPYLWLEVELPRSTFEIRMDVLSPQIVDFFTRYQKAQVSVDFTLTELIDEANRIEGGNGTGFEPASKFPYVNKQFVGVGGTEELPKQKFDDNSSVESSEQKDFNQS